MTRKVRVVPLGESGKETRPGLIVQESFWMRESLKTTMER